MLVQEDHLALRVQSVIRKIQYASTAIVVAVFLAGFQAVSRQKFSLSADG
jgi:hypothetical protein